MAGFLFLKAECNTVKPTARMIAAAFIYAAIFILTLSSATTWASSGQQTRTIFCQRTDGTVVNPANCNPATWPGVIPRPAPNPGPLYGPTETPCSDVECIDTQPCACATYS